MEKYGFQDPIILTTHLNISVLYMKQEKKMKETFIVSQVQNSV